LGRLNRFPIRLVVIFMAATILGCSSPKPSAPVTHPVPQIQSLTDLTGTRHTIVSHAVDSIGAPYTWGGTSPSTGFDCSGLVTYTHSRAGIATPRTAKALFTMGRPLPLNRIQPGDLVFFNAPDKNNSYHVGIYIGKNIFIHAPGRGRKVRQTTLDNPYFRQYFVGARSFL